MIAALYVDVVGARLKEEKWSCVEKLVAEQVWRCSNIISSSFRTAFGLHHSVVDEDAMHSDGPRSGMRELGRVTKGILAPLARSKVGELDQKGWKELANQLQHAQQLGQTLLSTLDTRMRPTVFERIIAHTELNRLFFDWRVDSFLTCWGSRIKI